MSDKIVISDTKLCPVQLESGTQKVSFSRRLNYQPKTIWMPDDCCTIVRLSSDVIVRPNSSE